jgi:hypothetical protein
MKNLIVLSLIALVSASSCKFSEAPSAGLAKEMCSCLFVAEQTEQYCRQVTRESGILANWEANYAKQQVVARGMNYVSVASMDEDSRFGCSIKTVNLDSDSQDKSNDWGNR